jgi:hypothetical protein
VLRRIVDESAIQVEVKKFLRSRPNIGSEREEHPHAAGGITDLSFRGLRLELKVEDRQNIALEDCKTYLGQTTTRLANAWEFCAYLIVRQKCGPAFPKRMESAFSLTREVKRQW